MLARLRAWLLDRSGLTEASLAAMDKPLPRGVGWLNTLGSAAMLILVVQAVTGMFLALYYAPVPGGAYLSVQYIDERVAFGRLVRGLHHYGASAAVILVFAHLLRVFFHGAYKPPRELIWLIGVLIFQIVLGFGFTGYLLPWDQKAYWGTVVGTEIFGSVPLVGPALRATARGGEEIGAVTLTHFYAVHVLLLPAILFPAIGLHLLLVWRKGVTAPGTRVGEPAPPGGVPACGSPRFMQHQMLKDAVAMGVAFLAVYLFALFRPPQLEFIANPAEASYSPRPDWYFLFLFQFLEEMGRLFPWLPKWIAAVVIPGLTMLVLALLPWLDRSKERDWRRRRFWSALAMAGLATMVVLHVRAVADPPDNLTPRTAATGTRFPRRVQPADRPVLARGEQLFLKEAKPLACALCHQFAGKGNPQSLSLDGIGNRQTYDWLLSHTRDPQMYVKGSTMPAYPPALLSEADLRAVTDYLVQPRPPEPVIIYRNP